MPDDTAKSDDYSKEMKAKMGSTLVYKHEDGINFARPLHRIVIGSCLQGPDDVDTLKKEGVGIVFCLQEDKDLAHFSIDIAAIQRRAEEVGVRHVRSPIRDFDPLSLRMGLPGAVTTLAAEMAAKPDALAYVHCTAGLGRAPGTALAYWFWVQGLCLDKVYQELFALRRCHPQIGMIRAATCDLLAEGTSALVSTRIAVRMPGASKVELAGLDVGWHNRAELQKDASPDEFFTERPLLPGTYQYKFIVDGEWMPSMDLPTVDDNGNVNNVVTVTPVAGTPDADRYGRIMAEGGMPTGDERAQLLAKLAPQSS